MWIFNYTVSILGNRVATLSRHSCPPFCYAGIMNAATQHQTLLQMKRDFHLLLSLEVSTAPAADQLASDLRLLFNPLVRLALSLFELNNWSVFDPTGIRHPGWFIMEAIFRRFPDSKIVEDCHQRIRNDASGNANSRQSASHIMELVQQAGVLEGREINHVASLQKEWFLEKWSSTKTDGVQFKSFKGHAMRLDKVFSSIMGNKVWPTISEDTLRRSAAAWSFLRQVKDLGCRIADGPISGILQPKQVLQHVHSEEFVIVVKSCYWGFLSWPLVLVEHEGHVTRLHFSCDSEAEARWHHLSNHDDWDSWQAFTAEVVWSKSVLDDGVSLRVICAGEPLILAALKTPWALTFGDLVTIAAFMKVHKPRSMKRVELLRLLAESFGEDFAEQVLELDQTYSKGKTADADNLDFAEQLLEGLEGQIEANDFRPSTWLASFVFPHLPGELDFIRAARGPSPPASSAYSLPAPDGSGHCRTSSASSRSQWAVPDFICQLQIEDPSDTAGLHLPAPDRSGHCWTSSASSDRSGHCRTSSASFRSQWALPDFSREPQIAVGQLRSQWALPDFICQLQIAVGTAGLQPRAADRSGHCRTSAASRRSQWALPDISREPQIAVGTTGLEPQLPDRSGHRRTSAATACQIAVGNAGLEPEEEEEKTTLMKSRDPFRVVLFSSSLPERELKERVQKHNDLAKKKAWSDGLLQRVEEKKEKKAKAKAKSKNPSAKKKAKAKPKAAAKGKVSKTRKRKAPTPDGEAPDIHEDQPAAEDHALAPMDENHTDALAEEDHQVPSLFGNGFEPRLDDSAPPNQDTLEIEEDKTLPMEVDHPEEQPLVDAGEDKAELFQMKQEVQEQEAVAPEHVPSSSSSVSRKKVHRKVECKKGHRPAFDPHFKTKSYSKQFLNIGWEYALQIVHSHAWQKWNLVKNDPDFQLNAGQEEQKPGVISQELLDSLKSTIDGLPPHKVYGTD
eukprot:s602_g8.t1